MQPAALVAIFVSLTFAMFLPMMLGSAEQVAAEQKSRARRLAEHQRNARLLRLDI